MTPRDQYVFLKKASLFFSLCKNLFDQSIEKVILLHVLELQESKQKCRFYSVAQFASAPPG